MKIEPVVFNDLSIEEINQNYQKYKERIALYKKHGFDQIKGRENIISTLGELPETILEVGTGKGHLTSLLAKFCKSKVVTIDLNVDDMKIAALNAAQEGVLDKIEFFCVNAEDMRLFADNSFELVVSAFSFHHFEAPFAVMREMMRVTKDKLFISDFNLYGFSLIEHIHESEGRKHQEANSEFDILDVYLGEYGFKVIEEHDEWQKMYFAKKQNGGNLL